MPRPKLEHCTAVSTAQAQLARYISKKKVGAEIAKSLLFIFCLMMKSDLWWAN